MDTKKVKLDSIIDKACFCAEVAMDEPVNILRMAKDMDRLSKFLADFCHNQIDGPRAVGRAYREPFDVQESRQLREVIEARLDYYAKRLNEYIKRNS